MGKYNFKLVTVALIAIFCAFIALSFSTNHIVSSILAGISFVLFTIWASSDAPDILKKDITKVTGIGTGIILLLIFIFGGEVIIGIITMKAIKPFLDSPDTQIWPHYSWYFTVMYYAPAALFVGYLTRRILLIKKLKRDQKTYL